MKRGNMPRAERAKQFMPFAALKGYEELLREKERIVVPRRELSEEKKEELDLKLRDLEVKDVVTVVYFHENEYVKVTGMISRIDLNSRFLKVVNTKIQFGDIGDLEIE